MLSFTYIFILSLAVKRLNAKEPPLFEIEEAFFTKLLTGDKNCAARNEYSFISSPF